MRQLLSVLIAMMFSYGAVAQVHHVPGEFTTIQSAIDASSEGDTVLVAEGTYFENIDFSGKAITVASQFLNDRDTSHISRTIINGSHFQDTLQMSVVTISGGGNSGAVLSGFTLTKGEGNNLAGTKQYHGGAIFINGNGALIEYNHITGNILEGHHCASAGIAAFMNEDDTLIIRNNEITGNHIISDNNTAGGGITLVSARHAQLELYDNIISRNKVSSSASYKATGGAIYLQADYNDHADIRVFNNLISKNELHCRSSCGGGLYIVFTRNTGEPLAEGQVKVYNNLILDNESDDKGGGIAIWNTVFQWMGPYVPVDPVLVNNTLVGNISSDSAVASGLFNYDAKTLLFNNILWDSLTSPTCSELSNSDISGYCFSEGPHWCKNLNDGVLYAAYNDVQGGWPGKGNINIAPNFEADSFKLAEGSACIGNGIDSLQCEGIWYYAPPFDFYGNMRPAPTEDTRVDIGAIESSNLGYVYIPDSAFLCALLNEGVDINGDKRISYPEAEALNKLRILGWGITDLTGIEAFINLDTLGCLYNELTELNVSNNTALIDLDVCGNQLTRLDLSGCHSLESLACIDNQLTALDVSGCTGIRELTCYNNKLTSLNVSGCSHLSTLWCNNNHLTELDLSNFTALEELYCNDNQLTDLDISGCTILPAVACYRNALINLDVSGCAALRGLYCSNNQLKSLDVSKLPSLLSLNCRHNQLTNLDVSACKGLSNLFCNNNHLTSLDVAEDTALSWLDIGNNELSSLDLTNNIKLLTEMIYLPGLEEPFPNLVIDSMPSLNRVCIPCLSWEAEGCMPYSEWHEHVDTTESPNVVFTTDCSNVLAANVPSYEISIYPNPSSGIFILGYIQNGELKIYNLQGQLVLQKEIHSVRETLDLSNYPTGMYLVEVTQGKVVQIEKLVVE